MNAAKRVTKRQGKSAAGEAAVGEVQAARRIATVRETVPIDSLEAGQRQYRKHFDPARQAELTESILRLGVQSPPWVRIVATDPEEPGSYELIAGERRWRAAKAAGLTEITVDVKTYDDGDQIDDEMALELAIVENNQRADPHPLEEADAFLELRDRYHRTAEQIASVIRRSVAYVYERLALDSLGDEGRKAMWAGQIGLAVAHALSRIGHEKTQAEAVKEVTRNIEEGTQVNARWARAVILRDFMLRIVDAPFATSDETLVASAGSCSACPKRSGNQGVLFEQGLGRADLCTDRVCWGDKRKASDKRTLEQAKAAGQVVLSKDESKALFPYGSQFHSTTWIELGGRDYALTGEKSWRDVIGASRLAEIEIVYAQGPDGLVETAKRAQVLSLLKRTPSKTDTPGIKELRKPKTKASKKTPPAGGVSGEEDGHGQHVLKERMERLAVSQLVGEVEADMHAPARSLEISRVIVRAFFSTEINAGGLEAAADLLIRRGITVSDDNSPKRIEEIGHQEIGEMDIGRLRGMLVELASLSCDWPDAKDRLLAIAEIDPTIFETQARAELDHERAAKRAAKGASKKAGKSTTSKPAPDAESDDDDASRDEEEW